MDRLQKAAQLIAEVVQLMNADETIEAVRFLFRLC